MFERFVSCASPCVQWGNVWISGTGHNGKLKFSMYMYTHLTHLNTIFEFYHVSLTLDNANVLYLEDGNGY